MHASSAIRICTHALHICHSLEPLTLKSLRSGRCGTQPPPHMGEAGRSTCGMRPPQHIATAACGHHSTWPLCTLPWHIVALAHGLGGLWPPHQPRRASKNNQQSWAPPSALRSRTRHKIRAAAPGPMHCGTPYWVDCTAHNPHSFFGLRSCSDSQGPRVIFEGHWGSHWHPHYCPVLRK